VTPELVLPVANWVKIRCLHSQFTAYSWSAVEEAPGPGIADAIFYVVAYGHAWRELRIQGSVPQRCLRYTVSLAVGGVEET
jgi:hypothetical protein